MISFGLVNIPIELHSAVKSSRPRFRLLHAKDMSPVNYERVCRREGSAVKWEDLVKGYEYAKGKYVALTQDDFKTAAVEKTKAIDILDFVVGADVDDRYFDTSYYAVPTKGGERGYAVLREALEQSGRFGIGKVVLRETQHLVAVYVVDRAIVVTMMRFADELVDTSRFSFPNKEKVRPKELEMAKLLIDNLANDWKPEQYRDDYRASLMRLIKAKIGGKKPDLAAGEEPEATAVVDLMERLRQSLETRAKTKRHSASRPAAASRKRKIAGRKRAAATS